MEFLAARASAFATDESGATAIEYGLIAALMAVACITAFGLLGSSMSGMFNTVNDTAGASMRDAFGN